MKLKLFYFVNSIIFIDILVRKDKNKLIYTNYARSVHYFVIQISIDLMREKE